MKKMSTQDIDDFYTIFQMLMLWADPHVYLLKACDLTTKHCTTQKKL